MPDSPRVRTYLAAAGVGIVVAIVLVGLVTGGFQPPRVGPAGSILFDGIAVNLTYNATATHIFGPSQQQTCRTCPSNLSGGETIQYLQLFDFSVPVNFTAVMSFNVTSVVPFQAVNCMYPGPCGTTTHYSTLPNSTTIGGGEGRLFLISLSVPNPAPKLPTGFWIYFNVTVYVTHS